MHRKIRYAVVGGDLRNLFIYETLKKRGDYANLYFFDKMGYSTAPEKTENYDVFILPIPVFKNGSLNAPYSEEKIDSKALLKMIPRGAVVFFGKGNKDFVKELKDKNISGYDYGENEEFKLKNAVLTAEGALGVIIQDTDKVICKSKILITGFGRIARELSQRLNNIYADVYICARKEDDLKNARALKMGAFDLKSLTERIFDFDIIINTVPAMIITKNELEYVRKNTCIIDLASMPGGVDKTAAEKLNIKCIHALSLPSKISPPEAGNIILSVIDSNLSKSEMKL